MGECVGGWCCVCAGAAPLLAPWGEESGGAGHVGGERHAGGGGARGRGRPACRRMAPMGSRLCLRKMRRSTPGSESAPSSCHLGVVHSGVGAMTSWDRERPEERSAHFGRRAGPPPATTHWVRTFLATSLVIPACLSASSYSSTLVCIEGASWGHAGSPSAGHMHGALPDWRCGCQAPAQLLNDTPHTIAWRPAIVRTFSFSVVAAARVWRLSLAWKMQCFTATLHPILRTPPGASMAIRTATARDPVPEVRSGRQKMQDRWLFSGTMSATRQ